MNNIRQLREAAGMKQSELADRMNVRPPPSSSGKTE